MEICPCCGSDDLIRELKTDYVCLNITDQCTITEKIDIVEMTCKTCESTGDFFSENVDKVDAVMKKLYVKTKKILDKK